MTAPSHLLAGPERADALTAEDQYGLIGSPRLPRRYVDRVRTDAARKRREQAQFDSVPRDELLAAPADAEPDRDDLLELLFLCCHPALTAPSQMALTLPAWCCSRRRRHRRRRRGRRVW